MLVRILGRPSRLLKRMGIRSNKDSKWKLLTVNIVRSLLRKSSWPSIYRTVWNESRNNKNRERKLLLKRNDHLTQIITKPNSLNDRI